MKQIQLTKWEAIKTGLLLSVGIAILLLIIQPGIWQFTIFGVNAMIIVFLFGIIGALLGRFLSRTRKGTWVGAGITLFLLFFWLYMIATNVPLD